VQLEGVLRGWAGELGMCNGETGRWGISELNHTLEKQYANAECFFGEGRPVRGRGDDTQQMVFGVACWGGGSAGKRGGERSER
jgi:hypothetical protein